MADIIAEKIKEIIVQQLEVGLEQLRPEASFMDDLRADSLSLVELILAVEMEYRFEIPEVDRQRISTVGDLVVYVNDNVK